MSSNPTLSKETFAALAEYDTPTVCNALEILCPDRRAVGFTTRTLLCAFPELPPMVGYARTATIRSMEEVAGGKTKMIKIAWWSPIWGWKLDSVAVHSPTTLANTMCE